MPTPIERDRLLELLDGEAQLVEVLPARQYEHMHLPDAIVLPLKDLSKDRALAELSTDVPVVTYCNGFL